MSFRVVIPARFGSSRFPGKVLAELAGRPLIAHVCARALESGAAEVVVATDDARVADAAGTFGVRAMMTAAEHASGTDRVAEVAALAGWGADEIVVNVQGDAPLIPPASIRRAAELLETHPGAAIATLGTPIASLEAYLDPHVVKVVTDAQGRALYFSRSPIPARGHGHADDALPRSLRHLGLYAYRAGALQRLSATPPCYLEQCERLEQLRALWLNMEIRVGIVAETHGPDVDTPEDLAAAAAFIDAGSR